jgi:thiol-disulfide isomerase/thioredoxin
MKTLIRYCIALFFFICPFVGKAQQTDKIDYDPDLAAQYAQLQGEIAPNFILEDDKGNKVSLASFRGKVVYLHIWAEWCSVCIGEMPELRELSQRFQGEPVVFLNVIVDSEKANWKTLLAKHQVPGVNVFDARPNGDHNRIDLLYGLDLFPAYAIIGKDGKLLGYDAPAPDEDIWIDWALTQAIKAVPTKKAYESYTKNTSDYNNWLKGYMKKL